MGSGAVVIVFSILGAGLKFIDDAFDEGVFSKKAAAILAPFLVVLWMGMSMADEASAVILFSILFAVLLTGKIDNIAFKSSALLLLLYFAYSGAMGSMIMALAFLTLLGVLDEIGNDYVDKGGAGPIVEFLFLHRFSMKVGVLILCLASVFDWVYLVAFLAFDVAYDSMGALGLQVASTSTGEDKRREVALKGYRPGLHTTVLLCRDIPRGLPQDSPCFVRGNLKLSVLSLIPID